MLVSTSLRYYNQHKICSFIVDCFLQYLHQEMEMDSNHVFNLAMYQFNNVISDLTHEDAKQAVIDAFDFLYTAHGPDREGWQAYLSNKGYMAVFLLQHLLVRFLTKAVMNLMTTEALIMNCSKIPYTYLKNYLENQYHFSLKDVISSHHVAVKATIKYVRITMGGLGWWN